MATYLFHPGHPTPRSVFLMDWGLTIVVLGGLTSIARFVEENQSFGLLRLPGKRVFIVGANDSGEALLRAIRRNSQIPYRVVGFIAEDEACLADTHWRRPGDRRSGRHLPARQVGQGFRGADHRRRIVRPAGSPAGTEAREAGVTVNVLPSYEQLLKGTVDLRPRRVSIEDLLHREPVQLDMQALHRWIDGRSLLVTGCAGSIGSEIAGNCCSSPRNDSCWSTARRTASSSWSGNCCGWLPDVDIHVCLADINDAERMETLFAQHQPDIVFHAAAYKHVPLMEAHVGEAVKNITWPRAGWRTWPIRAGVKSFVMISTDKAVNPDQRDGDAASAWPNCTCRPWRPAPAADS